MGRENFGRSYVFQAGPAGQTGFQIDGYSDQETPLHIAFSIEKSDSSSLNNGKVQLWNLAKASRDVLDQKDCMVILSAGYGRSVALILQGNITSSTTTLDGNDLMTELEVVDGRASVRDTYVSLSYVGKVNEQTIYNDLANRMGMTVVYSEGIVFTDIPNGFSYVGKAVNCLSQMTKNNGKSYSIQNGVLQIFTIGQAAGIKGYILSADTGLIEIPSRIIISDSEKTSDGNTVSQSGWEVKYFLNGAIGVNDIVQVESSTVRGYFRVHKISIDGDNLEGDWICTAQLLEVG